MYYEIDEFLYRDLESAMKENKKIKTDILTKDEIFQSVEKVFAEYPEEVFVKHKDDHCYVFYKDNGECRSVRFYTVPDSLLSYKIKTDKSIDCSLEAYSYMHNPSPANRTDMIEKIAEKLIWACTKWLIVYDYNDLGAVVYGEYTDFYEAYDTAYRIWLDEISDDKGNKKHENVAILYPGALDPAFVFRSDPHLPELCAIMKMYKKRNNAYPVYETECMLKRITTLVKSLTDS